jgi:hypothetical protein
LNPPAPDPKQVRVPLESKKYEFVADGTMPVLDIEIKSGKITQDKLAEGDRLTLELYHPLSGEIFEAKFKRGRIEVDKDGSVTYFTRDAASVNFSLFLKRNLSISLNESGQVVIKSPSKILSVVQSEKPKKKSVGSVSSDFVTLQLE